jgi:signal transduction histidine kinase
LRYSPWPFPWLRRSVTLRPALAEGIPPVWADRIGLSQVLEKLIGDALTRTPAGGEVIVGVVPRLDQMLFWIADGGAGIPAQERVHAGLGLGIVKGLVEAHGGTVWVESTVGRGSACYFTVPIAAAETVPRQPAHPNAGSCEA